MTHEKSRSGSTSRTPEQPEGIRAGLVEGPRAVQVVDLDLRPDRRTAWLFSEQIEAKQDSEASGMELSRHEQGFGPTA
jgi:hypothetical protein